jgi:hypothetical protein
MDSNSIFAESGRNKISPENKMAKSTTNQTNKIPTSFFLALAAGTVALSLGLALSKKEKSWATFVGQWVPTVLLLGIYDKIVKTQNSNKVDSQSFLH